MITAPPGKSPIRREMERRHGAPLDPDDWAVICETWLNTLWIMGVLDLGPGAAFIARKLDPLGQALPDAIERH